jgi:hypothetical protein
MESEINRYCIPVPQENFENAKIFVSRLKLTEYCKTCLLENESFIITEIGVLYGGFSEALLNIFKPKLLYLCDLYHMDPFITYENGESQSHYEYINKKFINSPVKLCKGNSFDILSNFSDNYFDYIYIDANHHYEFVKKDLEIAYNKIKSGGIIQLNDYTNYGVLCNAEYGVFLAVNEFLAQNSNNVKVLGMSLDKDCYHDIAIQITK